MERGIRLFHMACILLLVGVLAGCGGTRKMLGLEKTSPDEFLVVKRAPLSLPPNYELRPPNPGERRPQERTVRSRAKDRLFPSQRKAKDGAEGTRGTGLSSFPGAVDPAITLRESARVDAGVSSDRRSSGAIALLEQAGGTRADSTIRQVIDQEAALAREDGRSFVDYVLFWRRQKQAGAAIDPMAERRRLEESIAMGRPPAEGQTPTIERKKSSVRLFGDVLPTSLF
jgi:hypothetical protein